MATEDAIGLKIQTTINVAQAGPYGNILFDEYSDGSGRLTSSGRVRVGGSFHNITTSSVFGAAPFAQGSGPLDLNTIGPFLELAARSVSLGVYTPLTTTTTYKHGTFDVIPQVEGAALQYAMRDTRLSRLALNHPSSDEATFEFTALGGNVADSTETHTAAANMSQPSPAVAMAAGNSMLFGSSGFVILSLVYQIDIALNNTRRPLGTVTPDRIRPINSQTSAIIEVDTTAGNIKRSEWGAVAATAVGTLIDTGALNVRQLMPGGTKHITYAWSNAEYFNQTPRRMRGGEENRCFILARPIGTVTETIV